jgi:hypothetical protein
MYTENLDLVITSKATIDISKNRFVSFSGSYPALNQKALGVSLDNTSSGNLFPVCVSGVVLVYTSSAISLGQAVTTDSNGYAKPVESNEVINGYALDSSSGAGSLIRVLLK